MNLLSLRASSNLKSIQQVEKTNLVSDAKLSLDVFFAANNDKKERKLKEEQKIRDFFKKMGLDSSSGVLGQFIDFVQEKPSAQRKILISLCSEWLEEMSKPDEAATGGTISHSLDIETGTRVTDKAPNMGNNLVSTLPVEKGLRKQIVVYPKFETLDSSNQTAETQELFLNALGSAVKTDIKAIKEKKVALGNPGNYIPVEEISFYYDFPSPIGPGLYATHGTDTLDEDSSLSAYQMLPKVVVVTGSYATEEEPGSDATANKEKAKKLAENPSVPIGTYVLIGDEIHLATRLKKVNTKPWKAEAELPYGLPKIWRNSDKGAKLSYFASIDDNPVGYFDKKGKIHFDASFLSEWEKILKKRTDLDNLHGLSTDYGFKPAYVEHINMGKNAASKVFDDLVGRLEKKLEENSEACGAIIEGDFYGHSDAKRFKKKIKELADKNIFIIESAQKNKMNEPAEGCDFILPAQLRVKLSALLARDNGKGLFTPSDLWGNYAGEVTSREIVQKNNL